MKAAFSEKCVRVSWVCGRIWIFFSARRSDRCLIRTYWTEKRHWLVGWGYISRVHEPLHEPVASREGDLTRILSSNDVCLVGRSSTYDSERVASYRSLSACCQIGEEKATA